MKIFVLFITMITLFGSGQSLFKPHTVLESINNNFVGNKQTKNMYASVCIFSIIITTIYYIACIGIINTSTFAIITACYVVWNLFHITIQLDYIKNNKIHPLLKSKTYLFINALLDIPYCLYIIYFIIIHW